MASERSETYDAFISYSHAVDGALAPALQSGLQRFAKPWYRARAVRVFRDEASLSANPGLWSSIEDALHRSTYFILLASPGSASSPWVAREAAHWRATKRIENLLIALTEGELVWDPSGNDFDWERTNALPDTLREAFRDEPRFIDLRWAHASDQLSLSNGRFRDAVAELAAPLHGVPKDALAGEEVRQHRRTVRIARGAALALACLALASAGFSAVALRQRSMAIEQRDLAVSRSLAQAAAANLDGRTNLAALLSIEAYRIQPSAESRSGMIDAVERTKHMTGVLHAGQAIEQITLSRDRRTLAAAGTNNVLVWDISERESEPVTVPVPRAKALAIAPDRDLLAVGGPQVLSLWSLDPEPRLVRTVRMKGTTALSFLDATHLGAVDSKGAVVLSASTGKRLRRWNFPFGVTASAFALERPIAAVAGPHGLAVVNTLNDDLPVRLKTRDIPTAVAVSPDGAHVAALDRIGDDLTLWTPATGEVRTRHLPQIASALTFTPDGRTVVLGGAGGSIDLVPRSGTEPLTKLRGPAGAIYDLTYPPNGPLATAGEQGIIVFWDPSATPVQRTLARVGPTFGADFAESAETLAVAGFGNIVNLWDLHDGSATRRMIRVSSDQRAVAVDSTGTSVVVAKPDGSVVLFAGNETVQLQPPGGDATRRPIAISNRGVVAWGTPGQVGLWDLPKARRLPPLRVGGLPSELAFDGDGARLAVAGTRGVSLWQLAARQVEPVRSGVISSVALSRSGALLAYAADGEVVVWDTKQARTHFAVPIDLNATVSLAFSRDERTLAIGTSTQKLRFVDTESGALLGGPLMPLGGPVAGVDFSPDGATLATATQGGVITLWDDMLWSDVESMQRRLCEVAGESMTKEQWREFIPGRDYRETCP